MYNYYRPNGFSGSGEEGGGSANYGQSMGGCFDGPPDSAWTGTTCVDNIDTTQGMENGVPTDDIRQNCCDFDLCNSRPNMAAHLGSMGAVLFAVTLWLAMLT